MRHLRDATAEEITSLYETTYFADLDLFDPWHKRDESEAIGVRSAVETLRWVEQANEDALLGALILSGGR